MIRNSYQIGEDLGATCRRTKFAYLATVLDLNAGLLTSQKGEFETDQQYQERSAKLAGVMAGDSIAICEPLNDNPDIEFRYDTENQRFSGSFSASHNVWRDSKSLGSYKSRTRMGIPMTVKASVEWEYDVSLTIDDTIPGCLSTKYGSSSFSVPATLEKAPLIKYGGRIAYIARLAPPYVKTSETPGEPSLDNPYDVYTKTTTVYARLEAIAIVDNTGATVWKCEVGRLVPNQAPTPIGDPDRWVTVIDYPIEGYRLRLNGRVKAILNLDTNGMPQSCTVTGSSGSTVLDNATCKAWMKNAKFVPAGDSDGKPTAGQAEVVKLWP